MKSATAWTKRRLVDVAFYQEGPGLLSRQWTSDGMKVINGTNIVEDGCLDLSNTDKYISPEEFERKYSHFAVSEGDIVVSSSGTLGKVARVRAEHLPLMMNTSVIRFHTLDASVLLDDYLYAWLRSPAFQAQARTLAVGGVQQNFGPSHLKLMQVFLPPPPVQERVASVLSTYDVLIENNRRRMKLLEDSARLLYEEWFVRLRFPGHERVRIKSGVPEGWDRKALGDLCAEVRETVAPESVEPDTPYIGLEHIPRRSISLTEWSEAEAVTSTKHKFLRGDILFGKIRPYFHKVGIAFTDGVASSDAIVIRPNSGDLRSFVLTAVSSDGFVAEVSQSMREGSKMPRADCKQMMQHILAVPPEGLLVSFSETVAAITDQLRTLCFQNRKLRAARDLLLPRLMSGETPCPKGAARRTR